MIFYYLKQYFSVELISCNNNNVAHTPIFYNNFFEMDKHIVLVEAKDLTECLARVKKSIVICVDRFDESIDARSNDLIILKDPLAPNMTFDILNYILERFNKWESNMNEILHGSRSFLDLVNEVSKMLEVPVSLIDVDFRYIAYSDNSTDYMNLVDAQNQLPLNVVNHLISSTDYKKLELKKEAFLYQDGEKCIYRNIFYHDEYVGRLTGMVSKEKDEDSLLYYEEIFNRAAHYVEILYAQSGRFENTSLKYREIHEHLEQIANGVFVHVNYLDKLLMEYGCIKGDHFSIMIIRPQNTTRSFYSPSYLCNQIENTFLGCFCVWSDERFIVLCDHDYYLRYYGRKLAEAMLSFVKMSNLVCGESRKFFNTGSRSTIYVAKIQAEYALEQRKEGEKTCYFDFEDYALSYIISNGIGTISASQICHPALLILNDYDEKHETKYIQTLRVFFEERFNASLSARKLYIHRSSFLERMERIKKLTQIDLQDPDELLYLSLSFRAFFSS